jgi:nitroimidazol reductase NimA-like FMN-containing flavoprotein (pyridoxamine 5'-phosphate oxidase superfamily)
MAVVEGRTWLEHLRPEECWRLLRATPVGRIGVLVDSAPEIYPVNHVVDGESIVFRTATGSKLRGLDRSPSVCFQVDGIDPGSHTGWSVLVKGRATIVRGADEIRRVADLPLDYWTEGAKPDWIRITPHQVTGRRIWHGTVTTTTTDTGADNAAEPDKPA